MSILETLPVSVVLPTRNSMDKLPGHLSRHADVFSRCAEIIHCDSQSHDGTQACVATTLGHPKLKQFDHPPGLYPSWNYAIQQCSELFVYISTIGDQIDPNGLARLLHLAVETSADIVISPPRFLDEDGKYHDEIRWPINHLIANHRITQAGTIPSRLVYAEAVFHAPDGIMGSAASCLYRTSFLKPRPFPLGFYGACDSAWALRHVPEARCAIIPEPLSSFLLHPKSYESHAVLNARIAVLIRNFLRGELRRRLTLSPVPSQEIPSISQRELQKLRTFNLSALLRARYEEKLITLRKKFHGLWILSHRAWRARNYRNHYRKLAAHLAADVRKEQTLNRNLTATDR